MPSPSAKPSRLTPRRIIASYFFIAGLYTLSAALIWGVNTLFLLDAGLDLMGVFVANTFFALGNVLFEIPTGVLADTRGRRISFLWSVAILFATTLAYVAIPWFGGGLVAFSAVSVLMGLGFTFYSGAVEAWLVDALDAVGHEGPLDRVFARGAMVSGAAMLVGTATGGILGDVDLALPYVVRAVLLFSLLVMAFFTMREIGFTPRALHLASLPAAMGKVARESLEVGWGRRSVRLLMCMSFLQMGFITWSYHAWQPYFLDLLGRDAVWVAGVVAGLVALSMIFGNAIVDRLSQYCGRRTTVLLWAAGVQTVAAIGVGLAGSFWLAVGLYLLVTAAAGVTAPSKQAYLHSVIPSRQRASVVSFDSMLANAGAGVAQPALAQVSRMRSLADGYVYGGVATILVLPLVLALRALGEPADRVAGERCPSAATAGSGLTSSHLVDAVPRREAPAET